MNPYFLRKLVQQADARALPDGAAPEPTSRPPRKASPPFVVAYVVLPILLLALVATALWVTAPSAAGILP